MSIRPVQLEIYRSAIPMRRFEHAAAGRDVSEAVVAHVLLSDGTEGWGETLPRTYVTGETVETVVRDVEEHIWPALTAAPAGPVTAAAGEQGRCITAAACVLDVAVVGAALGRPDPIPPALSEALGRSAQWKRRIAARVSGVLGSSDPRTTARRLRLMRLYGVRHFKLKLGLGQDVDGENLRVVERRIGRAVAAGKCTLRVDVNGGWDFDTTPSRVEELARRGACVVEQPTYGSAEELVQLAGKCRLPLMADESLLTEQDAHTLLREPRRVWWNIRLSKNGGLVRSGVLVRLAAEHGVPFTLGCMVGESSILSAAQRRLLQAGPEPRFVEGNYGRFLLAGDLTKRSLRFGYGGRLGGLPPGGLGVEVDPRRLGRFARLVRTLTV
jgi:muconate cycloisomerase